MIVCVFFVVKFSMIWLFLILVCSVVWWWLCVGEMIGVWIGVFSFCLFSVDVIWLVMNLVKFLLLRCWSWYLL